MNEAEDGLLALEELMRRLKIRRKALEDIVKIAQTALENDEWLPPIPQTTSTT